MNTYLGYQINSSFMAVFVQKSLVKILMTKSSVQVCYLPFSYPSATMLSLKVEFINMYQRLG